MVTTDCSRRTPVWFEHNLFGVAPFHDEDDAVRTNLKRVPSTPSKGAPSESATVPQLKSMGRGTLAPSPFATGRFAVSIRWVGETALSTEIQLFIFVLRYTPEQAFT
jgi:hypothetical protein